MKIACVATIAIVAGFAPTQPAYATPQIGDSLVFGGRKYYIRQVPMLGLWDYGGGELAPGKERPPRLEARSSANWTGYKATWEIRNSQLFLKRISGRFEGKRVRNEEILPGREFPVLAKWFTGQIHLVVGDYDDETEKDNAVIVFHIQNGQVAKMTFLESSKPVHSWNGLNQSAAQSK